MSISRRQLYAAGEAFGDCATVPKLGGGYLCGGGDSSSSSTSSPTTTNIDKRVAVSDGIGVSGDGNVTTYNSPDAVVAIANAGAEIIKDSGGAVVDLYKNAGAQNADTWNKTITTGAALVDKLIDKVGEGFSLSEKVVDSFQPSENKNTDAIKWAVIAAGVVGVGYLFKDAKK